MSEEPPEDITQALPSHPRVAAPGALAHEPRSAEAKSLSERIANRFGLDADPIALEPEAEAVPELVGQLASRHGRRYRVKDEVGRGGMGAVLRVWDDDLRRHVAMKTLLAKHPARSGNEEENFSRKHLMRFLEEAQVTSQLDHPGIVPVHELGLDSRGQVYFTMKLVRGRTLNEVIELARNGDAEWSRTRVLEVVLRVCDAMAYAHDKGVIHRDLKPANIMVGRFGAVYVMDWGLSRILGRRDARDLRIVDPEFTSELRSIRRDEAESPASSQLLTLDGDVVGTPAYMSPEQADGRLDELGRSADVYSLGAILYHVLAGHMPYVRTGTRANNFAIWHWVRSGPPAPLHAVAPDVPPELVSVCEKAMERAIPERYASVEAMAADLRAYLEGRVVGSYETGAWAEARKWIQRNRPLAASLATAVLVLVLGLVTALVLRQRALENAELAREQERLAKKNAEDVLSLSALQKLKELTVEADRLWPPHPEHLDAYDDWTLAAEELVAGLHPGPDGEDAGHLARLAALRARALPYTEADREADRRSHPRFGELASLTRRVAALRKAQEFRDGGAASEPTVLDLEELPDGTDELLELANALVGPDRSQFGDESRGLALARLALERVEDDSTFTRAIEILAWALFATGRDDEALSELEQALEVVPDDTSAKLAAILQRVRDATARSSGQAGRDHIAALEVELASLETEVGARRTWKFADERDRWWHAQLSRLVVEIEAFANPTSGPWKGSSSEAGWGIAKRREFAARVSASTVTDDDAASRWTAAAQRVASGRRYAGISLVPQLGLVPIGADPESGLEEFGHPLTGNVPARDREGHLIVTEETSLVFVLLPGGRFLMGAQSSDAEAPNHDPLAETDEGPPREVELSPFFISKFEMTQAQWTRFAIENPSAYRPGNIAASFLHPVEQVDWWTCENVCRRMGLSLPTEAQWEYATRGGTGTVFWTGDDPESLFAARAANIADQTLKRTTSWSAPWEAWNDGYAIHAPVASLAPNPFGLHDVHGNVWEWCLDGYLGGGSARSARDPLESPEGAANRVLRGGGYGSAAVNTRSAERNSAAPESVDTAIGFRPARALRLP